MPGFTLDLIGEGYDVKTRLSETQIVFSGQYSYITIESETGSRTLNIRKKYLVVCPKNIQ